MTLLQEISAKTFLKVKGIDHVVRLPNFIHLLLSDCYKLLSYFFSERELNGNQSMIAFHTHVGVDTVTNPVVFDVVKLNMGEGYNSTSGIFTCKSDGLYGVTWTIESYDVEDVGTSLRVNGEIYGQTWSDGDSDNYDTSTGFVLITLTYGDLVWVAVDKGSRVDALQSTFSAWKIK